MGRYDNTPDIVYRGVETKGIWELYPWLQTRLSDTDILTFKVTSQNAGRPDLIAQGVYGNSQLYWVITSFNNRWYNDAGARNVLGWPYAGSVIYYPSSSVVLISL